MEPDQKYRLGTVINTSPGATYFTGSKSSPVTSLNGHNILLGFEGEGGGGGREAVHMIDWNENYPVLDNRSINFNIILKITELNCQVSAN